VLGAVLQLFNGVTFIGEGAAPSDEPRYGEVWGDMGRVRLLQTSRDGPR